MTPYLLILAVLLGIAPGLIAHSKGRSFPLWWIYGALLGPFSLLHAILLRPKPNPYFTPYEERTRRAQSRWRSSWPMALWGAASVAIAVVAVIGYGALNTQPLGSPESGTDVSVSADRTAPGRNDPATSQPNRAAESTIIDRPAAEMPVRRDATPTVRVSVRHETLTPPPEQLARAPAMPVERIAPDKADTTAAKPRERTEPAETAAPKTAPEPKVAARTDRGLVPPPAAPVPAPPPVATPLIPAAPQEADRTSAQTPPPGSDSPTAEPSGKQTAPPAAKPKPTNVTAVGETVQIVQLALAKKGYNPGPANGRAGIKTQTAIRKFQKDAGVQPTGAIDYTLLEKLGIVGPRVHAFRPPPGATAGR